MSTIFNKLQAHALELEKVISARASLETSENNYAWVNKVYSNSKLRRIHLDIIDVTTTKNLYMLHMCAFPNVNNTAPIYGFDIIAGTNKVTGAFLDFSPVGSKDHELYKYFESLVTQASWSKPRELPEWARNIFSPQMVAAGNISNELELTAILDLSKNLLIHYLDNISIESTIDYTAEQNYYCQQQKKNPHTPRVLKSLGFSEEVAHDFIHKELFPEL
jgi:uncharacterized membrane protein